MSTDKYQIRLLKIAEEDFAEIVTFIASEEIRNLGYRYFIIKNYIVFYTIEKQVILIHRILHSARNYKSFL
jgi:hypothetical protein